MINTKQIAELMNLSTSDIRMLIEDGFIDAIKRKGRWRISGFTELTFYNKDLAEEIYHCLFSKVLRSDSDISWRLFVIGSLIDFSGVLGEKEGLEKARQAIKTIRKEDLSSAEILELHYFLANTESTDAALSGTFSQDDAFVWEHEYLENEVLELRKAMFGEAFPKAKKSRQCQILTNLGNTFSFIGRECEALEYWDKALSLNPKFSMALGNKGFGLESYSKIITNEHQGAVVLKYAHQFMSEALELGRLTTEASQSFKERVRIIEEVLNPQFISESIDLNSAKTGRSKEERRYRKWALNNRLFLNPINDLGRFNAGCHDCLMLPGIMANVDEPPTLLSLFNQIKQEYVSARFFCYKGVFGDNTHFSDRKVALVNTLDYPSWGINVEYLKTAFRVAYSVFDKVGYFIDRYFGIGMNPQNISLKTIWYEINDGTRTLREMFRARRNWTLRGLMWISKDLYWDAKNYKNLDPDSEGIQFLRNNMEHKHLKVVEFEPRRNENEDEIMIPFLIRDSFGASISRSQFMKKTIKVLKLARSSIMNLAYAVGEEEKFKRSMIEDTFVGDLFLHTYKDEYKI